MRKPIGAPAVFVLLGFLAIVFDLWLHLAATAITGVGVIAIIIGGVLIAFRLAQPSS